MLKVFKIDNYPNNWSCTIEINPDFIIQERSTPDKVCTCHDVMASMISYWHGGDERLKILNGKIDKTFAQQLAREIFLILAEGNKTVKGVIAEFENREGWSSMDGSWGIKIIEVDDLSFDHDDFDVEEVK